MGSRENLRNFWEGGLEISILQSVLILTSAGGEKLAIAVLAALSVILESGEPGQKRSSDSSDLFTGTPHDKV